MVHDAVAHLPRQVEARAVVLQVVHDPQALLAVTERPAEERRERLLAQVTERRVSQIVPERDGLRQVLVQAERARDGAGDLRDVERVREPNAVVVALWRQEHLRLVLQPAERLGVRDAVAIPLEDRADRVLRLVALPPLRLRGQRGGIGERVSLDLLGAFARAGHRHHASAG